jgi:hypothetical protein
MVVEFETVGSPNNSRMQAGSKYIVLRSFFERHSKYGDLVRGIEVPTSGLLGHSSRAMTRSA